MKRHIQTKVLAMSIALFTLSACIPAKYRVGDQSYQSREEAWAAVERRNAESEAGVSVGVRPLVDRTVLFVFPTATAFSRTLEARVTKTGKTYAPPGTAARAADDFQIDALRSNFKSGAASLKKANIYQDVIIQEVDTTEPNIQPSSKQDVISFYISANADGGGAVTYFQSAKYGKQVVAVDTGRANLAERRRSFIDDIKTKALQ